MEEAEGVVKHIVLIKFKDEIPPDQIEQLIKGFYFVNHIETVKSCHWGKDVSTENLHQGFTHIFECTFESMEGLAEFNAHPAHLEFAKVFMPKTDKLLAFDYKPTTVGF